MTIVEPKRTVTTVKGSRNLHGFADHSGMKRFWSEEKPIGTGMNYSGYRSSVQLRPAPPFSIVLRLQRKRVHFLYRFKRVRLGRE